MNVNTTDANGATALSLPCGALGRRQFSNGGFTLERSFSMAERAGMIPEQCPREAGRGLHKKPTSALVCRVCLRHTTHTTTRQHDNTTIKLIPHSAVMPDVAAAVAYQLELRAETCCATARDEARCQPPRQAAAVAACRRSAGDGAPPASQS